MLLAPKGAPYLTPSPGERQQYKGIEMKSEL